MGYLDRDFETLRVDPAAPGVVVLTLDRSERFNVTTNMMFDELEAAARLLNEDNDVRVVVLTGAGRGFCSGYDLDDARQLSELGALGMLSQQEPDEVGQIRMAAPAGQPGHPAGDRFRAGRHARRAARGRLRCRRAR